MVSRWRVNGERARARSWRHAGPAAAVFTAGEDQRPGRGQRAPQPGQRQVAGDVQDEVVALGPVREVVTGVVQDVIGADRGTRSVLAVLQTPVTCAPRALAICTA